MKLVLLSGCPQKLGTGQLEDRPFPLDGRRMTLREIDGCIEALPGLEGWRAVAAAPGARLHRARLPHEPFTATDVRARVGSRLNEFIDDERRFVVDVERRQVLIPPVLWRVRGRLIAEHDAAVGTVGANLLTALLPYVNGSAHRRLQDAVGYACVPAAAPGDLAVLREE